MKIVLDLPVGHARLLRESAAKQGMTVSGLIRAMMNAEWDREHRTPDAWIIVIDEVGPMEKKALTRLRKFFRVSR